MISVILCRTDDSGASAEHESAYLLLEKAIAQSKMAQLPRRFWEVDGFLKKREHGKPFLAGYPDIHFNVSHSKGVCAAIVAPQPVGVDVQVRFAWKDNLAKRVMSTEELEYLEACSIPREKETVLNRIWCRKEALTKCTGEGLSRVFRGFSVLTEKQTREEEMFCEVDGQKFFFYETSSEQYCLCICCKEPFTVREIL